MMTKMYSCGDRDALVAYLYDECDAQERAAVAAHLSGCSRCSGELAVLSGTRRLLAAWTPPEVTLGFRLPEGVAGTGSPSSNGSGGRVAWWRQPLPAWAQMAAAIAIFAAGLSVGWSQAPDRDVAAEQESRRQLAAAEAAVRALESRVRGIEQATAALDVPPPVRTAAAEPVDVMPRVNAQIATWERGIRSALATREEVARWMVQLKREEAISRQQMRDEWMTDFNEFSHVFLAARSGE